MFLLRMAVYLGDVGYESGCGQIDGTSASMLDTIWFAHFDDMMFESGAFR